ncbi:DUF6684 family protein [Haloarcula nitratireducens]|uniref:Cox cluster protein n=1 Tax=Haloarcula nitratireducens TaxID=2487749 RepID=A0AAW4PHS5_9EURY|nr:DUF6684 family protein [Halomicroarcula nitratireducens]MBX0296742.1 hypothetical protein [Halomicroarcula nitratireducens]
MPVLGLDREGLFDSLAGVVPISIIVLLTLLFVVYNPWGWEEPLLIAIVFGLHFVPILTLAPVTYLLVRVLRESNNGKSETTEKVRAWFALMDDS